MMNFAISIFLSVILGILVRLEESLACVVRTTVNRKQVLSTDYGRTKAAFQGFLHLQKSIAIDNKKIIIKMGALKREMVRGLLGRGCLL